jgi:glycosidase
MSQNQDKDTAGFGGDAEIRHDMIWDADQWDTDLLAFFKEMIALRHQHPVLRHGNWQTLLVDSEKQLFGYKMVDESAEMIILFNLSGSTQTIKLEGIKTAETRLAVNGQVDVTHTETAVEITLPELSGGVFRTR